MGKKKKKPSGGKTKTNNRRAKKAEEKNRQKKREKVAKDMTYGLKNKKKSKKVQKYVQSMLAQKNNMRKKQMTDRERKKLKKLEDIERRTELSKYFGGTSYASGKKSNTVGKVMEKVNNEMEEEKELTIEEIVELERKRISGGTKVTSENFHKWLKFKRKMNKNVDERRNRLIGVVTGRELFDKNSKLFKDDEDAVEEKFTIDDDLFLDDLDGGGDDDNSSNKKEEKQQTLEEYLKEFTDESEYVPMMWNSVSKKSPKALLMDVLREKGYGNPKFSPSENDGSGSYKVKCTIVVDDEEEKEFVNKKFVRKKKMAEHTVSIIVIKFLKGE